VTVPDYIEQRLRHEPPANCKIIERTTPIISFGDVAHARVATLGLNPSRREFYEHGSELDGPKRRFETLDSLGVPSLVDASGEHLERVIGRCYSYFHGYPYRDWFDQLEAVLRPIGVSYYDQSACHLDLSQWATDPTWGRLSSNVQATLMAEDAPFLRRQLEHEHIELLLINGNGVTHGFRRAFGITLIEQERVSDATVTTRISTAKLGRIQVVAWSTNLQSAHGVTNELRRKVRESVARFAA
jgi:hypothetical protein